MIHDRRRFIASLSLGGLGSSMAMSSALAQSAQEDWLAALSPDAGHDQTRALQAAIDASAARAGRLVLPAGRYRTGTLRLPSGLALSGAPGRTMLVQAGDGPVLLADGVEHLIVDGLSVDGNGADGAMWHGGLVHIANAKAVTLRDCTIFNTRLNGVSLLNGSGRIEGCDISGSALTGLFVYDGDGIAIHANRIHDCDNGGIRIWRGENGHDGSIVTGNRIWAIDWTNGGNGQNGNGINVFRADGVIVADNSIADCAFSAVRLNSTNNTQVRGNTCLNSGEVAIFSEFTFSGSVIANNIVDNAAAGISMTNFNEDGRLASCTGNIVRNITPASAVNPDTVPYGIAAEADAIVTGNAVDNVPGVGILAGWGPYLRDVTVTGNLVRSCEVGVSVSVADGAGTAVITGNTISDSKAHAMIASRWWDIATTDLAADAGRFPALTVRDNTVI
ncbi:TIGR03808 family TAT-translocated repetitive protein [Pelagibacterium limicola]|uniref:TIGR03808 family TAT-translocated repetitive protein n=1 Tax=Pelagibacterium limicola TaxID=2791022 RepID=UPI0018AF7323|nr:TIGR03808 family TAT-translocated repetitive protein [Pelagibacterium limicola]